ncbi:MAG: hypothetical protein M3P34_07745 [Actinomycetota bacterium]|nr:hypothetical protein [Actinomycetota bacterium]
MSLASIVTLIAVAIGVAAIALYLIIVAALLNRVSFTVGTILIGVRAIANQTQPLDDVMKSIGRDVLAIESGLGNLLAAGQLTEGAYRVPPQRMLPAGR